MGLGRFVPRVVRRRLLDLVPRLDAVEARVRSLDSVVDALILSPAYVPSDDTGFNGQLGRKQIFTDITKAITLDAIVETGTWLGNTSAYMATTTGLSVHSCEINPRYHGLAKMRLADVAGVHLYLRDSREFLQEMSEVLAGQSVFFYLDAHWYEDVLAEELTWIMEHWDRYIVMVDDFAVQDDPGYEYDVFGSGQSLALECVAGLLAGKGVAAFYPALRSEKETGRRRGCVILAPQGRIAESLRQLDSVRPT